MTDINVQELFNEIHKQDISEKDTNLVDDGLIDSIDIMNLVELIERKYNITIDAKFLDRYSFKNFESIENIIRQSM